MANDTNIRYGSFSAPYFAFAEKYGLEDGLCRMGGAVSFAINVVINRLRMKGFNCTIKEYEGIGSYDRKTKSYSGMIQGLVNKEIDFVTMPVHYPLHDDNDEIEMSSVFVEDTMGMSSLYNISENFKPVDVLKMYGTIPLTIWSMIFFSFVTFVMLLHIALRRNDPKVKKTDATWITLMAFLDQDNFPTGTFLVSSLSLLVSTAMFFLMNYTTSNISTDLVVADKPIAITSYQDFIDRSRGPGGKEYVAVFCKFLQEYEYYRDSEPQSIENQVYKNGRLIGFDINEVFGLLVPARDQKMAVFGREVFVDGVSYLTIQNAITLGGPGVRMLRHKGKDPKKFTNVMVWSKKSNPRFQVAVQRVLSRMNQGGIMIKVYKDAPVYVAGNLAGNVIEISTMNKVTDQIEEVTFDFVPIAMENLSLFKTCYFSLISLSSAVLLFEMFYHHVETLLIKGWTRH